MSHQRRVYVVGQNLELRRMLTQHIGSLGAEAWPFASGLDFLGILEHLAPACILLDMDDGDVPSLEVLGEIAGREVAWPVIAVSGREELQPAIEAMKLGAIDFLRLPVSREVLALALVPAWSALERVVEAGEARRAAQERLSRLTAREMDVLMALLSGRFNKAIAHDFGISVRTVEMHRARIMAKLEVRSLAEAALLAPQAGLDVASAGAPPTRPRSTALAAPGGFPGSDARDQLTALARRLSS